MSVSVLGAGAFGTSLAIALARDGAEVTLWGRNRDDIEEMAKTRISRGRLPNHLLPASLKLTTKITSSEATTCLLAVPSQQLGSFLSQTSLSFDTVAACCKGVDQATQLTPVQTLEKHLPGRTYATLTGPSFAHDIAAGSPTALVLAAEDEDEAKRLQKELSRPLLRIYRTTDVIGAELGGALKNIVALAAGMVIGAGLGDSARASVIARGFSEMTRYAAAKGAKQETLQGLSGLGDLVLTCTSDKSRNFSTGVQIGKGLEQAENTVEGLATSSAVARDARSIGLELPLIDMVAQVVEGSLDISSAIQILLARPVGRE